MAQETNRPALHVTSSTIAGAVVGAGLLAAAGAALGYGSGMEVFSESGLQFSASQGALGGAAAGTLIGGVNGYANANRALRESSPLPPVGRRESWEAREIKKRALAVARAAEAQGTPIPSR